MEESARYVRHTVPLVPRPPSARAVPPTTTPPTLDSACPVTQCWVDVPPAPVHSTASPARVDTVSKMEIVITNRAVWE